jgi:predicted ATPase
MLKKIAIKNYRRFLDETIDFDDTVLIAGKNGAGKSSFVELIYKIKRFITNEGQGGYVESLMSSLDLPRWNISEFGQAETSFALVWECADGVFEWELTIQYNLKSLKCRVIVERLTYNSDTLYDFNLERDDAQVISDDKRVFLYPVDWSHGNLRLAGRVNSKIRFFISEINDKLFAHSITPEIMKDEGGGFDFHGKNFSKWFSDKLTQDIEAMNAVLQLYKSFMPYCVRTSISPPNGEIIINERKGANATFELRFSELSAGQKKLCVYYALLKTAPAGATIVLDEFENHLAPIELIPLYQLVQEEQESNDLQIIIVSHHSKTLNWYNDAAKIFTLIGEPAHIKIIPKDEESTVVETMERSAW